MGTFAAYYCIWNRGFTPDELKDKIKVISSSGKKKDDAIFKRLSALLSPQVTEQMRMGAAESAVHFNTIFGMKGHPHGNRAVIAYSPNAKWLPLFETTLCEGYTAYSKEAAQLSKLFCAPVLAFSIFDSDVLFVSYSDVEKGIQYDYAKPNIEEFEEFDTNQYSTEFPEFLVQFCDRSELQSIWNKPDEVFADDRLKKLCQLMQIDLLYGNTSMLEGYQFISAP